MAKRTSISDSHKERDSLFPKKENNNNNVNKNLEVPVEFIANKKNITKLIDEEGSSARIADSIRINPILIKSLIYWTTIIDPKKSKPDIIEEALLKTIPEEYLIEGYKLAKKQK